ncbi:FecCD family ABC transporter permease [Paenibacillus sp. 481]|uniref:FecCD family ABC transporter permease n=1 Tax=Paenibacillus sp. 481 TaxID=2835869 RepID=UPI001E4CA376|nr:iron ABC transporter permease [Paenibacillus sp. 481]UHA75918.1 iron ABC transporter permease [Paenibacillus sp. 481]
MRKSTARYWAAMLTCAALVLAATYMSLTNGKFDMTVMDVIKTLLRIDPVPEHDLVIFEFRMPRIVTAALIGFGLGIAGAVIQGITKNGLAEPGILGINAGAGAAIVIFMFLFQGTMTDNGLLATLAMPLFGLIGGLGAAGCIYMFARRDGSLDPQRLILVGIAISSGFGAISLYLSLKMKPDDFEMATVWLAGTIWNANWEFILSMLPWLIILTPILMWRAPILDLFQLEEASAISLGVATEKEKSIMLLCSIGIVSACVSVSGSVGFVGLLAPHMARRIIGIQHKHVLPLSGMIGMLLVVVSDFIGKTVFAPVELSVGIVLSIVGVPYFIYLLYRAKKR